MGGNSLTHRASHLTAGPWKVAGHWHGTALAASGNNKGLGDDCSRPRSLQGGDPTLLTDGAGEHWRLPVAPEGQGLI